MLGTSPRPGDPSRIERDDFPAPPYPYTDPERRRRWSETHRRISSSELNVDYDDEMYETKDTVDGNHSSLDPDDPKVKVRLLMTRLLHSLHCRLG